MARNWGGDGIERYLGSGETVKLRFGNFFLTPSRLGIYTTLKSEFIFTDFSDISIMKNRKTKLKLSFASIGIILALVFIIGELTQPTSLTLAAVLPISSFLTVGTGYAMLSSFDRDSYIIHSNRLEKNWKIRTFATVQGLTFVDELLKAINSFTPDENE